jgi:hypothetical protein
MNIPPDTYMVIHIRVSRFNEEIASVQSETAMKQYLTVRGLLPDHDGSTIARWEDLDTGCIHFRQVIPGQLPAPHHGHEHGQQCTDAEAHHKGADGGRREPGGHRDS